MVISRLLCLEARGGASLVSCASARDVTGAGAADAEAAGIAVYS